MAHLSPRHSERARLADAWAGSLVELDDAIFWIIIAQRRGAVPHSRYLTTYREQVRAVSEYEQQMDTIGQGFLRAA